MAFRFVHCADVHLDSPLRSLALRDPALAQLVGNATRTAFSNVVDLCLVERVDALILSGDLYDGDQTSMRTALFLGAELKRLDAAGIVSFVIRGNHDNLARITKELVLPESVTIFRARAEVVEITTSTSPIAIHGLSFAQAHAPDSLLVKYRAPVEGAINVGLLHTSLGGSPGHDPYAPCSPSELAAMGYRYWALGHIHGRSLLEGPCTIAMPGMPQGRDVGESGEKSVYLVTVADDGSISLEARRTSVAQFERVVVDLDGVRDWREATMRIGRALEDARAAAASPHLVARLALSGTTPLAWRLRRDADLLRAEAESRAGAIGATWIDTLEISATPPGSNGATEGPLGELRRSMLAEVQDMPEAANAVAVLIDELRRHLPPECRDILGRDESATGFIATTLLGRGCDEILARLVGEESPACA